MNHTDIISNWLGRLEMWIYDNVGEGDGTQLIRRIWADDPRMAAHLTDKWLQMLRRAAEGSVTEQYPSDMQKAVLADFLTSLDEANHAVFIRYIAENGRPKF